MSQAPSILSAPAPAVPAPAFLEPRALIATSGERRFIPPAWPIVLIVFGFLLGSAAFGGEGSAGAQIALGFGILIALVTQSVIRRGVGRSINAEIQAVNTIEELVQLRRWTEAADLTQRVLSRPMYLPERRLTALVCLATLLTRYHRFGEARIVHEYLLEGSEFVPDPSTAHSIRVARAMGMLREDYLVDADKAMSDLRREVNRARDEVRRHRGADAANEIQSGGLALLEMYRDLKTRHFEEGLAVFERSLPAMREQLGLRIADAWLLAAALHDGRGEAEAAARAYANATTLAPTVELHRRYPEADRLAGIYSATQSPAWPVPREDQKAGAS